MFYRNRREIIEAAKRHEISIRAANLMTKQLLKLERTKSEYRQEVAA